MHDNQRLAAIEHRLTAIEFGIQRVLCRLDALQRTEERMSAELDRVKAALTPLTDAVHGAVTLLGELSALVRNTAPTAEALNALADEIDADKVGLVAALVANTPAGPPSPPPSPVAGAKKP